MFQRLSTMGTEWTNSKKEQRRVVWCNQLAVLLIMMDIFFGVLIEAVVLGNVNRAVLQGGTIIAVTSSALFLNKFGHFKLARCVLIMEAILGITAGAMYDLEKSREPTTIVFILPVAMSFTLFDTTASLKQTYIASAPVVVITGVCLAAVHNESAKLSGDTFIPQIVSGLMAILTVSFCFHLLAKESRDHNDERLMEIVAGLKEEMKAREHMEVSLRKATQAKQDFLATMSHEIRTPMNGVVASADLLSDTPLNAEQQDLTDTIKSSALALITIINDILDFSKIEAGKMKIEHVPFNVRLATEEVLDCMSFLADERGVELVCDVAGPLLSDGVILSDPMRFRQVLLNLLGNAVKFTQDGSVTVEVRLSPLPSNTVITTTNDDSGGINLTRNFKFNTGMNLTNGAFSTTMSTTQDACGTAASCRLLQVAVTDTGVGIPSDRVAGLFQAFTQADSSTSRNHGGTGLGLTICSKLVALMGGKIGAQSQLGKGSTFSFFVVVGTATGNDAPSAGSKSYAHPRSSEMAAGATELLRQGPSSSRPFRGFFSARLTGSPSGVAPQSEIVVFLSGSSTDSRRSNDNSSTTSQYDSSERTERQDNGGGGGKKWGIMGWGRGNHRLRSVEPLLLGADDLPQQPARLAPVVGLVVVVCEPLGTARKALCNLLRHHREELQQEEEGGGQPRVVMVRAVPAPADLGALVRVLEEEEAQLRSREEEEKPDECVDGGDGRLRPCTNGQKRKLVVVCDYRMLGMESGGVSAEALAAPTTTPHDLLRETSDFPSSRPPPPRNLPPMGEEVSLQQRRRSLGGLLARLDAGLVLLGPRSHRSEVEAEAATDSILNMGRSKLTAPPTATATDGPIIQSRRRWEYVSKPIHMSLLLQALLQLTEPATDTGGSTTEIASREEVQQLTGDEVGAAATVPRSTAREKVVGSEGEVGGSSGGSGDIVTTTGGGVCEEKGEEVRGVGGGGEAEGGGTHHDGHQRRQNLGECGEEGRGGDGDNNCDTAEPSRGRETRVLVVEDNKVNQKVMGKMLRRLGVAFDIADNGQLAVEAWTRQQETKLVQHRQEDSLQEFTGGASTPTAAENYYAVVLMDCHMPVMDGFEATAAIRKLETSSSTSSRSGNVPVDTAVKMGIEGTAEKKGDDDGGGGHDVQKKRKRVPIIAVTASALEEDMKRCRDVGMDGVVAKPVRLGKIYEALTPFVDGMIAPPPSSPLPHNRTRR